MAKANTLSEIARFARPEPREDERDPAKELRRAVLALDNAGAGQLFFVEIARPAERRALPERLQRAGLARSHAYFNYDDGDDERRQAHPVELLRRFLAGLPAPPDILYVDGLERRTDFSLRHTHGDLIDGLNLGRESLARLGTIVVFLLPRYLIDAIRAHAMNLWTWRAHHLVLDDPDAAPAPATLDQGPPAPLFRAAEPRPIASPPAAPLRLFVSYSHKDAALKDKLLEHLSSLRRFENVDPWTDDRIDPGGRWRADIERAIAQADVALLLVSASFLASQFIHDTELPTLLQRNEQGGLVVVPVILRACDWQRHPALAPFQALPKDGQPITAKTGNARDQRFLEVAQGIARLAKKRHRAHAASASLGPPSNLEGRRDEREVIGRRDLLLHVRGLLRDGVVRATVLWGVSGIGKTTVAEAVASRALHDSDFPGGVFWLRGSDHDLLTTSLAEVAVALGISPEVGVDERADSARRALRKARPRTLLILDDLDVAASWVKDELASLAPEVLLLATTKRGPTGWLHAPGRAQWIEVTALAQDDAQRLVHGIAERLSTADIDRLIRHFAGHTLALEAAAHTLHHRSLLSMNDYLRTVTAGEELALPPGVERSALSALRTLHETLPTEAQAAWAMAGAFADAPIPVGWWLAALSERVLDEAAASEGIEELRRFSLLGLVGEGEGRVAMLHPLARMVAVKLATAEDKQAMARSLSRWMTGAEEVDPTLHRKAPPAWPHLETAWAAAPGDLSVAQRLSELLRHRGRRADLLLVERVLREALARAEERANAQSDIAVAAAELAAPLRLLSGREHLDEAEALLRRALAIEDAAFGPDAFALAPILGNLAGALGKKGGSANLEEAEYLLRRAVAISEVARGPSTPFLAVTLSSLANVLRERGGNARLAEAETMLRRAININEAAFGPDAPTIAVMLSNLGLVLMRQGGDPRLDQAEQMLRRAQSLQEAALGPDSPALAITLSNLAAVLLSREREPARAEAEALLRRALAIEEAALGPDAPGLAVRLTNLAMALRPQGGPARLAEAEALANRAVALIERTLGPDHPWMKDAQGTLALIRATRSPK